MPENVHDAEIDFNHQGLAETLADAGFEASLPGLFIWEGVTNYLTLEAVDSVFRYLGTLSLPDVGSFSRMCMAGSWTVPWTLRARRGFCAELHSWVSLGRSVSTLIRFLICFAREGWN